MKQPRNNGSVFNAVSMMLLKFCFMICCAIEHNNSRFRTRRFLTRSAVNCPRESAWSKLLKDGDNSSFLNLTGFDRSTFSILVDLWKIDERPRVHGGRKKSLNAEGEVGLLLIYLNRYANIILEFLLFLMIVLI